MPISNRCGDHARSIGAPCWRVAGPTLSDSVELKVSAASNVRAFAHRASRSAQAPRHGRNRPLSGPLERQLRCPCGSCARGRVRPCAQGHSSLCGRSGRGQRRAAAAAASARVDDAARCGGAERRGVARPSSGERARCAARPAMLLVERLSYALRCAWRCAGAAAVRRFWPLVHVHVHVYQCVPMCVCDRAVCRAVRM
eukprot:4468868-Prymnesium_polylepis.2